MWKYNEGIMKPKIKVDQNPLQHRNRLCLHSAHLIPVILVCRLFPCYRTYLCIKQCISILLGYKHNLLPCIFVCTGNSVALKLLQVQVWSSAIQWWLHHQSHPSHGHLVSLDCNYGDIEYGNTLCGEIEGLDDYSAFWQHRTKCSMILPLCTFVISAN